MQMYVTERVVSHAGETFGSRGVEFLYRKEMVPAVAYFESNRLSTPGA